MFNTQRPRSPTHQIPCHTDLTDPTDSSTTDLNINQNPLSFNQNHKNPFPFNQNHKNPFPFNQNHKNPFPDFNL